VAEAQDLQRFVDAQNQGGTYEAALSELRAGRKTTHWMWFVFPQIAGLGQSPISRRFAIASLEEARAYLAHPVLGPRLIESARVLAEPEPEPEPDPEPNPNPDPERPNAEQIFGGVDALKLRSSMTLFARAAPDEPVFARVLDHYFDGVADEATDRLLGERDQG
jgi:uncharacterized protein (DUF1810 family)